jgi:type VI secretion system protein ImpJ
VTFLSRVVWSEGMHLAQHHFQAQSRYFEDLTAFTLSSLFYRAYGFVALELDADALRNGTVSLTHARGVLPDGTPFHFPEDPLPAPLDVRDEFPPTHDALLVSLVLPAYRADHANLGEDGALRFRSVTEPLPDDTTGVQAQPVALARKNFRLSAGAPHEGEVTLPLARIRRDGAGHFLYDAAFIPPCLQLGANARLMALLGRLLEMLDAKAAALAGERRQAGADLAEYASREVASFWLAHAIQSAVPPLRHLYRTRTAHPEELFLELSRLAGALCTFSLDAHPRDLPLYDHDDAEAGFDALERHIRRHLDVAIPTSHVTIALAPTDPGFLAGTVADRRVLGRSHWYLAVRSSAPHGEVIARVPRLVKLCSSKHIVRLVKEAYPGLGLEHEPSPPADIAPRVGWIYFRVQRDEACWSSIVDSAKIGVYVPAAIPDAELQLSVILEG